MTSNRLILITGDPGCGKTTIIKKIADKLMSDGFANFQGFYTEELRSNRTRIGFDVIDVSNNEKRAALARVTGDNDTFSLRNAPKVGKYSVDIKSFESIAIPTINSLKNGHIYLIDEIGKMEVFSTLFEKQMTYLLQEINSANCLIVATVPSKSLSLSDKFKNHPMSQLFTVTHQNRNTIFNEIFDLIQQFYK